MLAPTETEITVPSELLKNLIARIDQLDANQRRLAERLESPVPVKKPTLKSDLIHGDCVEVMKTLPAISVDFILTDPPYLVGYQSRDGRTILNDNNDRWLAPAFQEMYRVLKNDSFCVSFYGWHKVDSFMEVWRRVGFRPIGHFVFSKNYASSKSFTQAHHESAYLLAKGNPEKPAYIPRDVLGWKYTGNKLHPTQKPTGILSELIKAYSKPGDTVLDPFAGSASTAIAAKQNGRGFIAIEKDTNYFTIAQNRLTPTL
ncbi:MAG: DNA methylase [Brasilonema angustatum HA4187-MV1]|jgi:site-specific DNA-methyltransferase (adenine-specific)|nr:DNA methylase [Brasilonema angustatum HA4187-MV1]